MTQENYATQDRSGLCHLIPQWYQPEWVRGGAGRGGTTKTDAGVSPDHFFSNIMGHSVRQKLQEQGVLGGFYTKRGSFGDEISKQIVFLK